MHATKHLTYARKIAILMDSQLNFFGIKVGLDPVIGLVPGVGDLISLGLSLYLIWIGIQLKLPFPQLLRMLFNVLLDTTVGAIPVLGDVADLFFRANMKNLKILERFAPGYVEDGEVISSSK
jgi:hypothetical protein